MAVISVFNLGTGHASGEPNNTIAKLHRECQGGPFWKYVNDGPGTGGSDNLLGKVYRLPGNAQGKSMNPKCAKTVEFILAARPRVVNLAGHSRGSVLCHMIANDLSTSKHPAAGGIQQVNMVLLDPVNMSAYTDRGGTLKAGIRLGSYVSIVMENVTAKIFPSKTARPLNDAFRGRMIYHHMPGTHGSGTQPLTSAIGRATFLTMKRCLAGWGTTFADGVPSGKSICEAYAGIHRESPVRYDEAGRVTGRYISDDPRGRSTSPHDLAVTKTWQEVGGKRVTAIVANYERMAAGTGAERNNLMNSPYFFNHFHMMAFADAFPATYKRFAGEPSSQGLIERELRDIEATCPNIAESFRRLGMID